MKRRELEKLLQNALPEKSPDFWDRIEPAYLIQEELPPVKKHVPWYRYAAAAACVGFAILIGVQVFHGFSFTNISSFSMTRYSDKSVATDFLKKFFTVDSKELSTMNEINKLIKDKDESNQVSDLYVSLYDKFKSDTTEEGYEDLIANRAYTGILDCAEKYNCTFQCEKVSLSQSSKCRNIIEYNYTAKIKVTYTKSKNQKEITESGIIQVIQEDQWKVINIAVAQPAEMIYDKS